jgi:hypothetical protein
MTSAGALMGTPTFMPPEVANGQAVDARADLYSLGCILYLLGAGHPPFVTDSIPEMIAMHGTQPAPPMMGVPAPLAAVIDRLLQKDPDQRYQTAAALRTALEDAHDASRTEALVIESTHHVRDATTREAATTPYFIPDVSVGDIPSLPPVPSTPAVPAAPTPFAAPRRRILTYALAALGSIGVIVVFATVLKRDAVTPDAAPVAPVQTIDAAVEDEDEAAQTIDAASELAIDAGAPAIEPSKHQPTKRTKRGRRDGGTGAPF